MAEIVDAAGENGAIEAALALFADGKADGCQGPTSDVFMGGIVRRAAGIRADKRLVHLFAMLLPAGGRRCLSVMLRSMLRRM